MSAIESSLRLEIAQYQANLAKAKGEAAKFREQLQEQSRRGKGSVMTVADAYAITAAKAADMKRVNPWTGLSAEAARYANIVKQEVAAAHQAAAAQEKAMRAQFLGGSMGGGYDSNAVLASQAQRSRAAAASGRGGRGGSGMNLGMAAMQFQDVAIQMQMGTRMSTIIAQQGSQMLSVLGPAGAATGAVVAIGGAFVTSREKAVEAFATMREESAKLDQSLRVTLIDGGIHDLAGAFETVRGTIKSVSAEMDNMTMGGAGKGFSALWAQLTLGDRFDERFNQLNSERIKRENDLFAIERATLDNSARALQIAELRAAGENDKADAIERQVKLEAELARIRNMPLSDAAKAQLSADATAMSAAGGTKPVDLAEEKRTREEIARLQEKFKNDAIAVMDPTEKFLALSNEQEKIFESMTEKGGLFYEQSISGLEAWSEALGKLGKSQEQLKVLNMLEQARTLESQKRIAAEEVARDRDQRDKQSDSARESAKQQQEKQAAELQRVAKEQAARDEARKQLQEDVAIAKAKEAGDTEKAAKLQQQADLRRKTNEIISATGLTKSQASAAAFALVGDSGTQPAGKSKIKSRLMGGPDQGALSERRPGNIPSHMMGGLNDFYALQSGKTGTLGGLMGPSAVGMSYLGAQAEINASRENQSSGGGNLIGEFISKLKTELTPEMAKAIVDALIQK